MVIVLLSLLILIPTLALLALGTWIIQRAEGEKRVRSLLLFLIGGIIILLLPMAAFARSIRTGGAEIALLLFQPCLVAMFVLLLLRWGEVWAHWQAKRWLFTALIAVVLILICLIALGDPYLILLYTALPLLIAGIWALLGRLKGSALLVLGALLAIYLWLESFGAVDDPLLRLLSDQGIVYPLVSALALLLGLLLSALLVANGTQLLVSGGWRKAAGHFILAGLLLLGLAATVYRQGMLVQATARGAEDHLPVGAIFGGLVAGLLVTGVYIKDERRIAGLVYTILVPMLMVGSYILGLLRQPLEMTEARAQRIVQAVERYHQDMGSYPEDLGALTPAYIPYILGPFTGRGQRWCYQGGGDYYRLGYVIYLRYHDDSFQPFSEIRQVATQGQPSSPGWMCDAELERIRQSGGL